MKQVFIFFFRIVINDGIISIYRFVNGLEMGVEGKEKYDLTGWKFVKFFFSLLTNWKNVLKSFSQTLN